MNVIKGTLVTSPSISVLLCEFKYDEKQDRRYCFELISSKKYLFNALHIQLIHEKRSWLFQAETEEELTSWMQTFEAAKLHAMKNGEKGQMAEVEQQKKSEDRIIIDDEEYVSMLPVQLIGHVEVPDRFTANSIGASSNKGSDSSLYVYSCCYFNYQPAK
jgi:hypothetical protein